MTDNSDLAALASRTRLLGQLAEHPGWAELERIVAERKEQFERRVIAGIWSRDPYSPEELAEEVAFHKAARFLLTRPTETSARLEAKLRRRKDSDPV